MEPSADRIQVRRATTNDAKKVSCLLCACYEDFGRTDSFSHDVVEGLKKTRGSVACVRDDISCQDVFVAEGGGRIKGMVSVRDNEITRLYIDPAFQRKGLGRALFSYAESILRDGGHTRLSLGAAGRSMLPFYKKMGMRFTGERRIESGVCAGMTVVLLEKDIDSHKSVMSCEPPSQESGEQS